MQKMEASTTASDAEKQTKLKIARILDEVKISNALHIRKLKELSLLRSKSTSAQQFAAAFTSTLVPLFRVQRNTASLQRLVRFVSVFATSCNLNDKNDTDLIDSDEFLEQFLRFLLVAAVSANKTARFRACQFISEIIMRLPDDAEVSDDLWDEVIESMKLRVGDKVSGIRTFAVRALSRFVNDSENSDILDLLLEVLPLEQNAEVRKTIVLSLPPSNATSSAIIDCTLDVSESVRKASYCVLAKKFPLQSLSIKLRTTILERGLADRSMAVSNECLKLMREEWLSKCCGDDPVELLKYLDVETYELVGEAVMGALLKDGFVRLRDSQSIRQYVSSNNDENSGPSGIQLMEPEVALYWKTVCRHLQAEAQMKGSDAAATTGTEAAVYAEEASNKNDLLDLILPATASDYVTLVKAHINAGANYRFASRQLLLLGAMLDFSDSTSRKVAGIFVQELLNRPIDFEVDDEGNKVIIGDGISLGGDKDWADAVSRLAKKVHAASSEFEEIVLGVLEELARPCRERTADFLQWMHSLAVAGLLLENAKSYQGLCGKAIEPVELLHSLLLPGAKHVHLDVQRVAIKCLGLFGLIEKKPSEELVKKLRVSFVQGPPPVSTMACKALVDLAMWHGPQELDRAMGEDCTSQYQDGKLMSSLENIIDWDEISNVALLELLYASLDRDDTDEDVESDENETVKSVLGEGFAKILLLSKNYPGIPASSHHMLLAKLISLYFNDETKDLHRLKQCLSVFFEHYPSLSADHKKCLSKAFIPVMRSMWPSIFGNAGGSSVMISNMRKRAVQASRYMLQMMQAPLYARKSETEDDNGTVESPETVDCSSQPSLECGEEGLAIRIAAEVMSFSATKKTAAERSFISALCRILVSLDFRISEQAAIKLMRRLLNHVAESASTEKDVVRELKSMSERLKSIDKEPDEQLPQEELQHILGKLELDLNMDDCSGSPAEVLATPAPPRSTRPTQSRRRVRQEEPSSSEEDNEPSPTSVAQTITQPSTRARSQRASKTAALTKMTANRSGRVINYNENEEENSDVTEEESDDSDEYAD